jgi:hypothetical protein
MDICIPTKIKILHGLVFLVNCSSVVFPECVVFWAKERGERAEHIKIILEGRRHVVFIESYH